MPNKFSHNIAPFVRREIDSAKHSRRTGNISLEFSHLETAHVLGQESTCWHVRVHTLMLIWAVRNLQPGEFFGQLLRIVGAAALTAIGRVPWGNTGGANVSPFKVMPVKPELQAIIDRAKSG